MRAVSERQSATGDSPGEKRSEPGGAAAVVGPLRVAVVGGGKMGQHHIRAIQRLGDRVTLVGVVDSAPDTASRLAQVGINVPVHGTLDALLEASRVDAVHICTPPETHAALATRILNADCHVYIEKPVAHSAAEAAELLDLARRKGLKVSAGHQLLYEAPARRMLELLPALGEVVHLESYFSFKTVRRTPGGRAPLRADLQLLDILPHPVYLLVECLHQVRPEGRMELESVQVGPKGTIHALIRRGGLTGTLIVTLAGRPVESYVRVVGTNGSLDADFVRGTVQRLLGPGSSGIDKAINPYLLARQLVVGTTSALLRRLLKRQRSYPGLVEIFTAFYDSIQLGSPVPVSYESIVETVRICEAIAAALASDPGGDQLPHPAPTTAPICVTGGTGFLGAEVIRVLRAQGHPVRCLARRLPPRWEAYPGVEYRCWDLAEPLPAELLDGVETLIHCAAETAGGWEEHRRNSIGAVDNLVRAAAAAGVQRIIHIGSLAVLAEPRRGAVVSETSPLQSPSDQSGPYVWGKLESEQLLRQRASELGLEVRVVRPGAILDGRRFEPPGRLGKRIGNIFVAVGSKKEPLGVVDVRFAAQVIAWLTTHFDEADETIHLLASRLPTREELVGELQRCNPDISVIWLPRFVLEPLAVVALGLQKLWRPRRPAIDLARVFAAQRYDNTAVVELAARISSSSADPASSVAPAPRNHA